MYDVVWYDMLWYGMVIRYLYSVDHMKRSPALHDIGIFGKKPPMKLEIRTVSYLDIVVTIVKFTFLSAAFKLSARLYMSAGHQLIHECRTPAYS